MKKKVVALSCIITVFMILVSGCSSILIDRDYEKLKAYYEEKDEYVNDSYSYIDDETKEKVEGKQVDIFLNVTKELVPIQMLDIARGLEKDYDTVEISVRFCEGDKQTNRIFLRNSRVVSVDSKTAESKYISDDEWIEMQK